MPYLIGIFILLCLSQPVVNDKPIFGHPCPKSCSCNLPWFMNGAFVDCSTRGFDVPPADYPQNTVELDLSNNRLIHIPYLKTLHRLRKLDLAQNRLADIRVESIEEVTCNIEELILAKNQISRFPIGLPKSLTHLDLDENMISTLSCSLLSTLPPMTTLILSKNMLSVLTKDSFCPNFGISPPLSAVLRNLDLSGNNIHILEEGVFRCLTQLERLNLSGNLLSIVGPQEFVGLTTLKILDLSNNALLQIGDGSFIDMTSLYYLNLKMNQLTSPPRNLPPNVFVLDVSANAIAVLHEDGSLFAIKHILIGHNPLICDCRIRWIRNHLIDSIPVNLRRQDCPIDLPIPNNQLLNKKLAPRCANPPSLAGRALDQIEDDKLVCCVNNNHSCGFEPNKKCDWCQNRRPINTSPNIPPHTSSKLLASFLGFNRKCQCPELPENPWARVHHNNRTNLLVEWIVPRALEGTTVEVQFHMFGFKNCTMSKKVPISDKQLMLSDLKSDTNYIICVMPTHCVHTLTPFLLDSCFEIRTGQAPAYYRLATMLLGSCTCPKRFLCTLIILLLIAGLALISGQLKHLLMRKSLRKSRICK